MKVLVTGVSGFVGGAVHARLLADPRHQVLGVSRRPGGLPDTAAVDLELPVGAQLPLDWHPDVIIHAAARVSPWGPDHRFVAQNVTATAHLLRWAEQLPERPRVVHISTSSVYYTGRDQLGLRESDPLPQVPINAYAATKAASEELVRAYAGPWVILRPRAVIGPGDTQLLPRVLDAAARGLLPALRRDPPAVGDLVDIDTLVTYLLRAASRDAVVGQTINVTNGEPVDLQATLHQVLHRVGLPTPTRSVSPGQARAAAAAVEGWWRLTRRRGEPPITRYGITVLTVSTTFDVTLCRQLLGLPEHTLSEAIDRVVAHHRAAAGVAS